MDWRHVQQLKRERERITTQKNYKIKKETDK